MIINFICQCFFLVFSKLLKGFHNFDKLNDTILLCSFFTIYIDKNERSRIFCHKTENKMIKKKEFLLIFRIYRIKNKLNGHSVYSEAIHLFLKSY